MADVTNNAVANLSIIATTSERIKDLVIKNGQLIFMHDVGRIAWDFKGKRVFYNQIIEIESEQDRINYTEAVNGRFYFVIETAELWRYFNGWQQLTSTPKDIVFIGVDEMPELGNKQTLYVNKKEGNESISIWDEDIDEYRVVSDKTYGIEEQDILALFN